MTQFKTKRLYDPGGGLKSVKNVLMRTNVLVSSVLILGFIIISAISYTSGYKASLNYIEKVSYLTSESIYYQLKSVFTKPINISLTMAHDSLLVSYLSKERDNLDNPSYSEAIKNYLAAYKKKYDYDSVFLVSTATNRYYNFNGVDRVLTRDNLENEWYFNFLKNDGEYFLNVDNDEVKSVNNDISVFVNCKVKRPDGSILGVVGVGLRVNCLQQMLKEYENKFDVDAFLISDVGLIQVSTIYTGFETTDFFKEYGYESIKDDIMGWNRENVAKSFWTANNNEHVVSRYVNEMGWNLIIKHDTSQLIKIVKQKLFQTTLIMTLAILVVLLIISRLILKFNKRITDLITEKEGIFKKTTEQLYDNIYELNITHNRAAGENTSKYFESLGAPKDAPYDETLKIIAEKQIKEEFRHGYVSTFSPENVLKEYEQGNDSLCYDFMISEDGSDYFWMRIDARIFYYAEDDSIHMYVYRKNIDNEKRKEALILEKASTDEMTGLYTKTCTEKMIKKLLSDYSGDEIYGFYIIDIDDFKNINDKFGHAFGDEVIKEFARTIKGFFRKNDITGRLGGDEFAAFIPALDEIWIKEKAGELSDALNKIYMNGPVSCKISASIGVSVVPADGVDFISIYKKADEALYITKNNGKNGFTVYSSDIGK